MRGSVAVRVAERSGFRAVGMRRALVGRRGAQRISSGGADMESVKVGHTALAV